MAEMPTYKNKYVSFEVKDGVTCTLSLTYAVHGNLGLENPWTYHQLHFHRLLLNSQDNYTLLEPPLPLPSS